MKKLVFTIHKYLERLFFVSKCASCGAPGEAICPKCLLLVPLSEETEHSGIYGIYNYGYPLVSHAIWNLKYKHKGQEAKILIQKGLGFINEIIAEHLQSESPEEIVLVPVPQYKKKTRKRGFNQSEVLASWITSYLPYSKLENILEKTKDTLPQSHLSDKKQRLRNVDGAMRAKRQIDKNKLYIIIDDVTTTGATFLEARRALKDLGARNVLCIALAHGYKRR